MLAEEGLRLAERNITRKYAALNHELRGRALAELGNIDDAIAAFETAVSLADAIQYQPIRWRGRHQLSELLGEKGREQEMQQTASEVEEIIDKTTCHIKAMLTSLWNAEDQRGLPESSTIER